MDEEAKKRIAEFRFGVIHDLLGDRKLARGQRKKLLQDKTASEWDIPHTGRTYISNSTILSWLRKYERGGRQLQTLYPEIRRDRGRPRAMDEETAQSLCELKRQLKGATLPVIIREAHRRKIIGQDFKAGYATVYRLFKQRGLMNRQEQIEDRRKFEAELPNDIWQSDCMHGPLVEVEGKQRKSYLYAFLDDMSRLIPHAEFYPSERLDRYIAALRQALKKRGLPRKLYVDNGPAFRAHLLSHATASLGIALIHSKPYQPQGRGKIERFFRTVRMQFLSAISEGMSLEDLNEALRRWIDTRYHAAVHSSTRQTPLARYLKHAHLIREAPKDLDDHFRQRVNRKVDRDRTVSLNGRLYEAPVHLIGSVVTLLFHEDDPVRVESFRDGVSQGMLLPLDVKVNCKIRRRHDIVELITPESSAPEVDKRYEGGKLFQSKDEDCHEL